MTPRAFGLFGWLIVAVILVVLAVIGGTVVDIASRIVR